VPTIKRSLKSICFLVLFSLGTVAYASEAPPGSVVLTLEDCINTAISGHPDLAAGRADLQASEARVGQAQSSRYPSLGFSTGYSEGSSGVAGSSEGSWSSGITLSQLVTDWGRTHATVRRSLLDVDNRTLALEAKRSDVVFEVTRAYFQLLRSEKDLEVAEETLTLNQVRLEQAEAFFKVGKVSKYDVTAAQVSKSNADLALIRARTSRKEAMTALKAAMGLAGAPDFRVLDVEGYEADIGDYDVPSLDEAIGIALENRPDLLAYQVALQSAETSFTLARLDNVPQLNLSGNYGWGDSGFWGGDSWRAGVTLSFPLYDGGLQREKTREALADLEGAEARLEAYRQIVVSDVTQAVLTASDASEAVSAASEGLRMATENLEIATGRYRVGVGSPLEVSDATRNYTEAKAAWYAALYDRLTARAALEKAMGVTGR